MQPAEDELCLCWNRNAVNYLFLSTLVRSRKYLSCRAKRIAFPIESLIPQMKKCYVTWCTLMIGIGLSQDDVFLHCYGFSIL